MRGVLLREVLDPVGAGNGEVDRLAGGVREAAKARRRELDERLARVAARVPEEDRAGSEAAAFAEALDKALAL